MQCVWRKGSWKEKHTHTHTIYLDLERVTTFLANNLNWSIRSAVCVLRSKAKQETLVSVWFFRGDLCRLFRRAISFILHVAKL